MNNARLEGDPAPLCTELCSMHIGPLVQEQVPRKTIFFVCIHRHELPNSPSSFISKHGICASDSIE